MLEIRDLVKIYSGPVVAIESLNMQIPTGLFGLLGPNGSGKTTLMRILAGLLEPTSGRVLLDGNDVVGAPPSMRARVGYLPQYFGFYPNLSGHAMLLHMLRLKGVESPRGEAYLTDELLERVNLSGAARRSVKTYSGGMRQRLGIAQAIAGNPRLLIVDEPTAGLDPEERQRFYRLLAELATDRVVILSTHIVEDVATLCSRFAVLRFGRLLSFTTPHAARTQLAGCVFEGPLATDHDHDHNLHGAQIIQSHLAEGQLRARVYSSSGDVHPAFSPASPTLEDAYLVACAIDRDARARSVGAA